MVRKSVPDQDLVNEYVSDAAKERGFGPCGFFEDGQEFILEGFPAMPEGFVCDWAWTDIHRAVVTIMFGGDFPWMKQPGTVITCCTDPMRPVIFKIERIG